MSRSAAARQAARDRQAKAHTAEDLLQQLAALGVTCRSDRIDEEAVVDEKELLRQIGSLEDDEALLAMVESLDAEDTVLRQLEASLLTKTHERAAPPQTFDFNDCVVVEPQDIDMTLSCFDESDPALQRQLAALMRGECAPTDDCAVDEPQSTNTVEPPACDVSDQAAKVEDLRRQLLDAKRRAVALKREGRIPEARAALAEVKRLQALVDGNATT